MSEPYDGQTAWREKLHMDDNAVQRLGRSVIRAGVSLPFVLLYALAPKPEAALDVLVARSRSPRRLGFRALVRLKTWGVLALGAAGALMLALAGAELVMGAQRCVRCCARPSPARLLLAAAAPFFAPMARWVAARALRRRSV